MEHIDEDLGAGLGPHWKKLVRGAGSLEAGRDGLRFTLPQAPGDAYSNAQIDDYQGLARRNFPWYPPLDLGVRARFSHPSDDLRGTAGFGFWNDPFLMTGLRIPALPRATWFFFASPPSDMKLDLAVPGSGWTAATIDALRPAALWLAPLALPAILLMNVAPLYRRLWPPIQRVLNIAESELAVNTVEWHTYSLAWRKDRVRFAVAPDGVAPSCTLEAPAPRGPLGFVMWMDNQYLVATPQGRLRWGLVDVPDQQWLEVSHLTIRPSEGQL
jgi:hypothetical protein